MNQHSWVQEFKGSITVCDSKGIVLEMNDEAFRAFEKEGGKNLIGTNLLDCHPEKARAKLLKLMEQQGTNVYTIEKKGIKKLIYQTPWYLNGEYKGYMEISFVVPASMPHFVRG